MQHKLIQQFQSDSQQLKPSQQQHQQDANVTKISSKLEQKNTNEQHHDSCSCKLCRKQSQIQELKKLQKRMHLQSCYKNDFSRRRKDHKDNNEEEKQHKNRKQKRDRSQAQIRINHFGYLDLQSTYNNDYVNKKSQLSKMRPMDHLGGIASFMPASTTYMRSYNSTITPKPDDPFKRIQMPVGTNGIPFSSQSIYQKAFNRQHSPKPNLPFIHQQAISKPRSIGVFESTHKKSYSTIINPQKANVQIQRINTKPVNNLIKLPSFAHNYDTTYRNFFIASHKKIQSKHDIDEIGNVYMRRGVAHKH